MKTSRPQLSFVIRKSKIDKKGQCPVNLRIRWKGGRELSTGIKVSPSDWSDKRQMCIRDKESNLRLRSMLSEYEQRVISLESCGVPFSVDDIVGSGAALSVCTLDGLLSSYLGSSIKSVNTQIAYKTCVNLLKRHLGESFDIRSLGVVDLERFKLRCLSSGMKEGSVKSVLSRLKSLWSWCDVQGYCRYDVDPWKSFQLNKLKTSHKDITVEFETMRFVMDYLMERMVESTGGSRWHYLDGVVEELGDRCSDLFALYFFVLMFVMQGLSPVDLCLLRKEDLRVVRVNGCDYWCVDTSRKKTKVPVKFMRDRRDAFCLKMFEVLKLREGELLLPVLEGVNLGDEKLMNYALANRMTIMRKKFRRWVDVLNNEIRRHNIENDDMVAMIDPRVTYYTARHSFAKAYIQQAGANPLALASLMGRSVNGIATYVSLLTRDEQVADAASVLKY